MVLRLRTLGSLVTWRLWSHTMLGFSMSTVSCSVNSDSTWHQQSYLSCCTAAELKKRQTNHNELLECLKKVPVPCDLSQVYWVWWLQVNHMIQKAARLRVTKFSFPFTVKTLLLSIHCEKSAVNCASHWHLRWANPKLTSLRVAAPQSRPIIFRDSLRSFSMVLHCNKYNRFIFQCNRLW